MSLTKIAKVMNAKAPRMKSPLFQRRGVHLGNLGPPLFLLAHCRGIVRKLIRFWWMRLQQDESLDKCERLVSRDLPQRTCASVSRLVRPPSARIRDREVACISDRPRRCRDRISVL